MNSYVVGGAVRDQLLNRPVHDRDWVVVGSTPDEMRAAGYVPVGADFPVFIHPQSREEYALARTERKTARGYHGFTFHAAPEVTLEDDLRRRDLTVNAMARSADGTVIDPWGGKADLAARILRHVSPAFAEDPVRILRVARFAARFDDFRVAPETEALMARMVGDGEADALVPERVWREVSRGLMEPRPSRMFEVLRGCGALARILPEVDRLFGIPQPEEHHPEVDTGRHVLMVLDVAARLEAPLTVRYACLCHDLGKGLTPANVLPRHTGHERVSADLARQMGRRLRVSVDCAELADIVAKEHGNVHRSSSFGAAALLRLLERCDALRRPQRFTEVLLACECDARGRLGREQSAYPQRDRLLRAQATALAVDATSISTNLLARGIGGPAIGIAIREARLKALEAAFATEGPGDLGG
ncbi:MAG: multifunctional CCA addition/repair protein [Caldimonas sp.]